MISGLAKGSVLVAAVNTGVTRSVAAMTSVLKLSKLTAVTAKGASAVVIQSSFTHSVFKSKAMTSSITRKLGVWCTVLSIHIDIYTLLNDIHKYNDGLHNCEMVSVMDKMIRELHQHRDEEKRKFDECIENFKKQLSNWNNELKKYIL